MEPSSQIGCAASMCIERGEPSHEETLRLWHKARAKPAKPPRIDPPRPGDGIRAGTCRRCGLVGAHADAGACIDALRDRLASIER